MQHINVYKQVIDEIYTVFTKKELWDSTIIIYGLNVAAKLAVPYLLSKGVRVEAIVDNSNIKNGLTYCGIPIIYPKDFLYTVADQAIILIFSSANDGRAKDAISINPLWESKICDITRWGFDDFSPNIVASDVPGVGLPEVKQELYEMLCFFKKICEKYQLRYYLDAGTLLGAVRHKGFIPWDDDIDVTMPVPDYIKFLDVAKNLEKYFVESPHLCDTHLSLATITKIQSKRMAMEYANYPNHMLLGIGLDIWPIAGFPADEMEQIKYSRQFVEMGFEWKKNITVPYDSVLKNKRIYYDQQMRIMELMTKYDYDKADYCGHAYCDEIINNPNKKINRAWRKDVFGAGQLVKFETEMFMAPSNYAFLLREFYNDYMVLPPVEKRNPHNFEKVILLNGK